MSKKRSRALVLLSVFIIGALATCFAMVPASAATEYVTYSYRLTTQNSVCAFEGYITYPSGSLSVSDITTCDSKILTNDDTNGKVKFNATSETDVFDLSSSAVVTITFQVKGNYSPSDVYGTITDIYNAAQVRSEDTARNSTAFDYVDLMDNVGTKAGHTDLDNEDNSTSVAALKFAGNTLALGDSISIYYLVSKTLIDNNGYTNLKVDFVDENGDEVSSTTEYSETILSGYYAFMLKTYPQNLGVKYSATLSATIDGVTFKSAARQYSVLTYCNNQLAKSTTPAKLKTLIVDLLNYGAASQAYIGQSSDKFVNKDLTSAQQALATAEVPTLENVQNNKYVEIENPEIGWRGATLSLQNTIAIRMYVASGMDLTDVVMEAKPVGVLASTVAEHGTDSTGDYYEFKGLNPGQMAVPVDFTLKKNGVAISNTYRYSINTYLGKQLDKSTLTGTSRALLESIAKYGDSSYNFTH